MNELKKLITNVIFAANILSAKININELKTTKAITNKNNEDNE